MGTVFTIWDRLSGRLLTRDASPDERTGVPGELDTYPQRFAPAFAQPLREARARAALVRPATWFDPTSDGPAAGEPRPRR
jgi:hypothetical protein